VICAPIFQGSHYWLTSTFSNRELAIAFWLCVFSIWALSNKRVALSIWQLITLLLSSKIGIPIACAVAYTAMIVWLLALINLWSPALLKDTVLWFCFTGFVTFGRALTSRDTDHVFWPIVVDALKVTVILEFIVNTYTFSFLVELLLVALAAITAALNAYAEVKKETEVLRLTNAVLIVIGLLAIINAAWAAIADYQNLGSFDTLRAVLLIPLLTVLFIPFVFVAVLMARYEMLFISLKLGPPKSWKVRLYAKLRVIMHCGTKLTRLSEFKRAHYGDLRLVTTMEHVDGLF
jgi:hypothetical protein